MSKHSTNQLVFIYSFILPTLNHLSKLLFIDYLYLFTKIGKYLAFFRYLVFIMIEKRGVILKSEMTPVARRTVILQSL